MKPIDLMIFDFDGTLVDTGEDIVRAVNHTLRSLGIGEKSREEIISYVGDGMQVLLEKALGPEIGRYEEAKKSSHPSTETISWITRGCIPASPRC